MFHNENSYDMNASCYYVIMQQSLTPLRWGVWSIRLRTARTSIDMLQFTFFVRETTLFIAMKCTREENIWYGNVGSPFYVIFLHHAA